MWLGVAGRLIGRATGGVIDEGEDKRPEKERHDDSHINEHTRNNLNHDAPNRANDEGNRNAKGEAADRQAGQPGRFSGRHLFSWKAAVGIE